MIVYPKVLCLVLTTPCSVVSGHYSHNLMIPWPRCASMWSVDGLHDVLYGIVLVHILVGNGLKHGAMQGETVAC